MQVQIVEFFLLFNGSAGVTKSSSSAGDLQNHSELFLEKRGCFSSYMPQPHYSSHPLFHSILKTIILIQYFIHPQREVIFFTRPPSDMGRSECRVGWNWEGCSNLLKDTTNPRVQFYGQRFVLIGMKQQRFLLPGTISVQTPTGGGLSLHTMRPTVTCHCHQWSSTPTLPVLDSPWAQGD